MYSPPLFVFSIVFILLYFLCFLHATDVQPFFFLIDNVWFFSFLTNLFLSFSLFLLTVKLRSRWKTSSRKNPKKTIHSELSHESYHSNGKKKNRKSTEWRASFIAGCSISIIVFSQKDGKGAL